MPTEVPAHFFDQSAIIPWRLSHGELEVLLISSRKKKRWVIPKGVKEFDLEAHESAAKEALEEAGIEGEVKTKPLGRYEYKKWGGTCKVEVFAMGVHTEHDIWEENYRDREWVSVDEASERLDEPELKRLVQSLPKFLRLGTAHPAAQSDLP